MTAWHLRVRRRGARSRRKAGGTILKLSTTLRAMALDDVRQRGVGSQPRLQRHLRPRRVQG